MTRQAPPHIVVAGGGVAALETVVALRSLAGPLPHITVLAPGSELVARPASVAAPFGFGLPTGLALEDVRRRAPFSHRRTTLHSVDAAAGVAIGSGGSRIIYDHLVVAVGARPEPALAGAITFGGPADAERVTAALDETSRLAFVLPAASTWALPVYELAMMAAAELRTRGQTPEITIVTPEPAPLWSFGPEASSAVVRLLSDRGIGIRAGARAVAVTPHTLELSDGSRVMADRVIALPRLAGPAVSGLPQDDDGFIPVDAYGRVPGAPGVYAAGDATTFPLKQGGLATQQADAVAEAIAVELGALEYAAPFRPVLRGLLLTGGAPLYLRSQLSATGAPTQSGVTVREARRPAAAVSGRALWWPPTKIAGRYLAPLLATARPPVIAGAQLQDLPSRPRSDDGEDALELALLLAEQDAAVHDYRHALHSLDAAAALTGGVLPEEWSERRDRWLAALRA